MDDILEEFIVETNEGLDNLDRDLVLLEEDPSADEVLSRIFRTIHTIKGSSGFLALGKLEAIAHVGENLLSLLRDGAIELTPEITSALLQMADAVREIISHVEREQNEGTAEYPDLVVTLTRLARQPGSAEVSPAEGPEAGSMGAAASNPTAVEEEPGASPEQGPVTGPEAEGSPVESGEDCEDAVAEDGTSEAPVVAAEGAVESVARGDEKAAGDSSRAMVADSTIRVNVGLLDTLMNLVGELVLARNQILQHTATRDDPALAGTTQRLNLVTTELQEGVMKTRMQPIGSVWSKFPRVVRDLALTCGKSVAIEMEGRDTELDKTIIESIKDPLTHVIRNAVDHGIETPEERRKAGKPAQGCILLRAFHEGGHVNIEIIDDGAGIRSDRVRAKAVEKGLVDPERADRMTEKELVNLITLPGFSTAEAVTNVSGRGVGMGVVRTNIEKIGGNIDIQSSPGQGTTLKIKIPLTLAIIPALIVTNRGDRFAIPQVNLLELVRLEGEQVRDRIELIHGAPVYRLRGELLPLAFLGEQLGGASGQGGEVDGGLINIVVLQAGDRSFGLVVESILDTEEIVVKPLGSQLKSVPSFAGAAIMGDGKVALILDVMGLAQNAAIIGEGGEKERGAKIASSETAKDTEALLLVGSGEGRRAALPLSSVARLEEFDMEAIERSGDQEVVQYRGEIMPFIRLSNVLGYADEHHDADRVPIVVVRSAGRSVGIAVAEILDILDDEVEVQGSIGQPILRGAVAVQGRVTDLLDVDGIVEAACPNLAASSGV